MRTLPVETENTTAQTAAAVNSWSREEFARAVRPLFPALLRLCRTLADSPEQAEDLLQNALVKAYQHRAGYRAEAPLLGWLYGIVRNEHMDHVRHTARRRGLIRDAVDRFGAMFEDWFGSPNGSDRAADPERALDARRDTAEIFNAMRELPDVYRSVVWLCDIEELSYQEVSDALSLPLGTVKSRHARGRARLRSALEQMVSEGAKS